MKFQQQWQARAIRPDGSSPWFEAQVPGNVQADYARYMDWGDVNYGMNAGKFRETENYTWEYRTRLKYMCQPGEQAVFVSLGIDYSYEIYLEGQLLLSHEGMFTPVEIALNMAAGRELLVRIHPHPKRADAPFEDRAQADQCVKPAVCYGWDWHPRLLVSGLWQDCYVETRYDDWIERCEPFYTLNDDYTQADIRFDIKAGGAVNVELYDPNGVYLGTGDHFTLANPLLWWCNGQGLPHLYTYVARSEHHVICGKIGLRRVRLIMNEGAWQEPAHFPKGRSVAPIQLELNGRPIFAKGSNWVSPDIFAGLVDEKRYKTLLTLAQDAHMNILRCWGGSGINKQAFYDLCDQMGIMLWVEFPLACNNYIATPHYLEILEQEATAILNQLRCHTSVVMYCGGNELFNSWSEMTDQSLALRLLNKICYELDQNRPFLMTSPVYGMGHGGYTFWDPAEQKDVFSLFQDSHCTAYTEFGNPGFIALDQIKKIIPEDELWPAQPGGSWELHHAFNAWGKTRWFCLEDWQRYAYEPLDSLEKIITLSQWMQCEGYKAIFEEARRQAPYCSMAINWCFNEPWIVPSGNSLLTYPALPKPAYYAVQSALRPVMASARVPKFDWKAGERFQAEIWLLNDSFVSVSKSIHISLVLGNETFHLLTWETGSTSKNKLGPTVNLILPDVDSNDMVLILECGSSSSSQYRLNYRPAKPEGISRQLNV